jgi:hypothetical protein
MNNTHWHGEHSIETSATPAQIWRLFSDVSGWTTWNAGVEAIQLDGPFATGTELTMKTPGQDAFRSKLIDVREHEAFVDETRVEDLVVTVAHRIVRIAPDRTRVTYATDATGPGAEEIGPAIASDFPDVLQRLIALAEAEAA